MHKLLAPACVCQICDVDQTVVRLMTSLEIQVKRVLAQEVEPSVVNIFSSMSLARRTDVN